ncbi:uncharacterized protein LOC132196772 [Neocloeon triangulifer]|uniref:uncharacterized protein LOC132196772 n=1 Tax=Neocloeon triangulifer TaxID=2078957 RepID=UPI00286F500A|nr:uncharacterized protein LOC132196772 [Neocloeon triangulifer]
MLHWKVCRRSWSQVLLFVLLSLNGFLCQNQQQQYPAQQGSSGATQGAPPALPGVQQQPPGGGQVVRRSRGGFREWRRGDPSLVHNLWKSRTPLGNAEVYIVLALLIGFVTVVIGCWLSDNCWSPEPEHRRFVPRA